MSRVEVSIDYGNDMLYCEDYYQGTDQLMVKSVWINGSSYGYKIEYHEDGTLNEEFTGYYLDGFKTTSDNNKEGYCHIWNRKKQ
jgi:hypothetical protein